MAISYTSQSISGYNSSPPADDGSSATTNEVTWAGIKTKLADPIKTLSEAINTQIGVAMALGAGVTATNTFTLAQYFSDSITVGTGTEDADGSIVASRLRIGPTATEPSAGHIALTGGIRMGTATEPAAGQIVAAGLQIGVTATAPGTSQAVFIGGVRTGTATQPSAGHIAIGGGLRVGPTATEPTAGYIMAKGLTLGTATEADSGGAAIAGGLRVGPTATVPTAGYIMAKGLTLGTATEATSGGIRITGSLILGSTATETPGNAAAHITQSLGLGTATSPAGQGAIRTGAGFSAGTATHPSAGRINAVQLLEGGNRVQFTKSFTSTDIPMSGVITTLAHSLATSPKIFQAYLKSTAVQEGYTATDVLTAYPGVVADESNVSILLSSTATSFGTRFNKSSATTFIIQATSTTWFLVVRAWA